MLGLPEVETIILGINAALQNQRIESVWIPPYFLRKIDLNLSTLVGQKFHKIKRIGKYLLSANRIMRVSYQL